MVSGATHRRTICGYEVVRRVQDPEREIYLARELSGRKRDVLLVLLSLSEEDAKPLHKELDRCDELEHPAITHPITVGREDGHLVVAFEAIDGTSLFRLMRYVNEQDERLGDGAAMHIGLALMGALTDAHGARMAGRTAPILHGQLGPHQVLISWAGQVKVIGFGLAPVLMSSSAESLPDWLQPYLAPEVRNGDPVTVRANVYSAAAMLWSLLSHQPLPALGQRPERLRRLRPDLPPSVTFPLDRALEPSPERRISAKALEVGLSRAVGEADSEELRWAMEVCRVRCTVEDDFLPLEAFPTSSARVSHLPSHSSLPPESDEPTRNYDKSRLLDQARLIGPLPWEESGHSEDPEDSSRSVRSRRSLRDSRRRGFGSRRSPDSVGALPSDAPPSWAHAADQNATVPAPGAADADRYAPPPALRVPSAFPPGHGHGSQPPGSYTPLAYGSHYPAGSQAVPGSQPAPGSHYPVGSQFPPGYQPPGYYPGYSYGVPPPGYLPQGYAGPMSHAPGSQFAPAPPQATAMRWAAAGAIIALVSFIAGLAVAALGLGSGEPSAPSPAGASTALPTATATATRKPVAAVDPPRPSAAPTATAKPAEPPPSAAPAEPPASAAPVASAEPAKPEPPKEPPADAKGSDIDPASLPAHEGLLYVSSPIAGADVFVHGRHAGPLGEWLQVACGTKYVRLGTKPPMTTWLEPGSSVTIACRDRTKKEIQPRPPSASKPPTTKKKGQFLGR